MRCSSASRGDQGNKERKDSLLKNRGGKERGDLGAAGEEGLQSRQKPSSHGGAIRGNQKAGGRRDRSESSHNKDRRRRCGTTTKKRLTKGT